MRIRQHQSDEELEALWIEVFERGMAVLCHRQSHSHWAEIVRATIIVSALEGHSASKIAKGCRCGLSTVHKTLSLYDEIGVQAIVDRRHYNPGKSKIASDLVFEELKQAMRHAALDGREFSPTQVTAWLSHRLGKEISLPTGSKYRRLALDSDPDHQATSGLKRPSSTQLTKCPHCSSSSNVCKNGWRGPKQNYLCKNCNRQFVKVLELTP